MVSFGGRFTNVFIQGGISSPNEVFAQELDSSKNSMDHSYLHLQEVPALLDGQCSTLLRLSRIYNLQDTCHPEFGCILNRLFIPTISFTVLSGQFSVARRYLPHASLILYIPRLHALYRYRCMPVQFLQ